MPDTTNHFDSAAADWDAHPHRVALTRAVGEAIVRQTRPTRDMDVLDYGCGTGLLGLFLLPHVRSVTGADSSPGMLRVLEDKIRAGGLEQMHAKRLDLQHDPVPEDHYHLIVTNMVMHHVEHTEALLGAFHQALLPGGTVAIADLDAEPGVFHDAGAAESVHHHGFDRRTFMAQMTQAGFVDLTDTTAHTIEKPIPGDALREFPVFLIVGRRG